MNTEKRYIVKESLVSNYAEHNSVTLKEARQRVNTVLDEIINALADPTCDGVMIRNQFTIEKLIKQGRTGVVAMNGKSFNSPSALKLKISTGKDLFARLNSSK